MRAWDSRRGENWKKCRSNKINWVSRVGLQQSNSRFEREWAYPWSSSAASYFGTELYYIRPDRDIAFVILSRDKRSCSIRTYRAKVYRRTAHGLFHRNITCGPMCDVRILRKPCWKWKYRENSGYKRKHMIKRERTKERERKPARNVFFSITWSDPGNPFQLFSYSVDPWRNTVQ